MNIESFRQQFSPEWFLRWQEFLSTPTFDVLWNKIKDRGVQGHTVYPYSKALRNLYPEITNTIFRPFLITPYEKTQVIIIDLAPTLEIDQDNPVANGLALTGNTKEFYQAVEDNVYNGLNLNMLRDKNLDFLAYQGVLLLNSSLTRDEAATHGKIWDPFITYFLGEILQNFTGLHIVFIGSKPAEFLSEIKYPGSHHIYMIDSWKDAQVTRFFQGLKVNNVNIMWDRYEWSDVPF